ncbi:MAG: hypothetical protein ABIA66_02160, partial [Candidatus Omnitrophota bacterium]
DDSTTYLAIDYSLGLKSEFKDGGPIFYLKLERNGPYDYGSPLFVHNTLMTTGGAIERYRNDELLPELEEFWLDTPLFRQLRLKLGLYTYEVGNGFSLNGAFENYGVTLFRESENLRWRLYYCRPDASHKNRLGPRIKQDIEQGVAYEHNAANFFATDVAFNLGKSSFQPYVGVLTDYTSAGKRLNSFTASVKRDILGTFGLAWSLNQDSLSLNAELARNFGKAESDSPGYKDIYHTGYLFYAGADYCMGNLTPSFQFLLTSGNKVNTNMAEDDTLTSSKNRAFSCSSPLNNNLGDSISNSNVDMLPIVAMGGGYGLNYGIPRPGTFCAADFDNLIMPSIGFDFNVTDKLAIGFYGYYLSVFEKGVGMLGGKARYLSRELGYETDLFIDYQLNQNTLVSFLAGCFFPGRYYKELRDDTDGSLFSPFVRGDGKADTAYQFEIALELKF